MTALRNAPSAADTIRNQVMWNRLNSIVEEQAQALMRASFSPAVREGGDLAAGIFDLRGRMMAQAVTGTPGHVNTMAAAVPHFLRAIPPDGMRPGDAFITNDPWIASGHLHDVTIVTPAFFQGSLVGYFAALVHIIDVGGRGMGPDARQVFEEGICLPIMHLAREGTINADLMRILLANTREPAQVEGDILAIAGAGEEGARGLVAMMAEFGITGLEDLSDYVVEHSHQAILRAIAKLRPGAYRNTMVVDGYDTPIRLEACMQVAPDGISVDYTGSSDAVPQGINVVYHYTLAYTVYGIKCLIAPGVPNNHGSMLPFTIAAPEGSILNCVRPAPVAARHIVGHALPDVVLGCLHQATEGGAPAEGSMMWNPYLRGARWFDGAPRAWEAFYFNSGGMGARPSLDGLSATAFPSGIRGIPVEAAEAAAPVLVWRKELRPDSAGPGRFRGGFGQVVEIGSSTGDGIAFQAMFDRVDNPAHGRDGGGSGAPGTVRLASGGTLRAKGLQNVPDGDRLVLEIPGGGGHGDPGLRDPARVAADVADGLLSPARALRDYGVALDHRGDAQPEGSTR